MSQRHGGGFLLRPSHSVALPMASAGRFPLLPREHGLSLKDGFFGDNFWSHLGWSLITSLNSVSRSQPHRNFRCWNQSPTALLFPQHGGTS